MKSLKEFAKFLLDQGPEKNALMMALYNYIRNFADIQDELNQDFIEDFYQRVLTYPYWKSKNSEVQQRLNKLLAQFFGLESQKKFLSYIQIVSIEDSKTCNQILQQHYESLFESSKTKVIDLEDEEKLVLVLHPNNELNVYIHNSEFRILGNHLSPLNESMQLEYDDKLQLKRNSEHFLPVGEHKFIRLSHNSHRWVSQEIQGYTMKRGNSLEMLSLKENANLFFALKKYEINFISKSSDPYYMGLTRQIERAIDQLSEGNLSDNQKLEASKVYNEARNAFEKIFHDDRLLHLLLKELAVVIASSASTSPNTPQQSEKEWQVENLKQVFDSTNLLPIVE
ncbi:MAG: hypothetical protein AB8E15_10930 [Bdellovibrionales bacterium]